MQQVEMSDAPGMYCHACHHQWQRADEGAIECPSCRSASTEIITPENDPRHFHSPQAQPAPAPTEPSPAPPGASAAQSESRDQEMRDAPTNNQTEPGSRSEGNNTHPSSHGPQPQIVFMFPPVTFFTTTIIAPIHGPMPSPAPPIADRNAEPASAPAPAPTDRPASEPTRSPFNFFPLNLFMPQRPQQAQESPSAPPPTGTNSPPSGADTPTAAPTASPESPQPAQTQGPTHGPVPLANFAPLFSLFTPIPVLQGNHPGGDGEHAQIMFNRGVLDLFRILAAGGGPLGGVGGDAAFTEQDFERILGRLWENSQPRGAPPASQAAIDALETKAVDEAMLGGSGARCVVCVDDLAVGEKVTSLPCGHFFHGECVVPWLKAHNTCPTCRGPIESDVKAAGKAAAAAEYEAHHNHPQAAEADAHQPQQQGAA